ncbi:DNA helicase UvrD [Paenibacillus oralis]|uniref:DNA helicase UvrD n=1 Tax=Paenibacillus oralis TaxID=2490856 RepID=A0A3P3UAA3_9BACL|nr:UvrD-helicase domain-containing protein [Paenibacillus oralis]RRJ67074.1 DNA helicase UvrD [Paenibacillus oralis]
MEHFQSAYQEEKARLDRTLEEIERQLKELRSIPVYTGHDFTEQLLEANRESQRKQLEQSVHEPYFGRLDFAERGRSRTPIYIGKVGVGDPEVGHPLVIDWRAPIASLFYSFTGGDEASYIAPEGLIDGLVYLKRNIVIRKGILDRVVDTYDKDSDGPAVSDEFLVYRLGENKDNRLRDIVSTIQAEQDQIIRAAKNTALIIQGVAGSGKTTVALHRLAFLLYQYKEQISAERLVIFAPNHMFIDYISEVLPELGVGDIQQNTFSDWAARVLDLNEVPSDGTEALSRWFDGGSPGQTVGQAQEQRLGRKQGQVQDQAEEQVLAQGLGRKRMQGIAQIQGCPDDTRLSDRFKGSMHFKTLIDVYLENLESVCVPEGDFEPWDGARLSRKEIIGWFEGEYRHYPVARRKERVLARIHRWIEMELKKSPSTAALKERKKKAQQREKAYAKKWPELAPLSLYRELFGIRRSGGAAGLADMSARIPREIWRETQGYLKKNALKEEDLPALLYLYSVVNEIDGKMTFDHVVIDEAQDFSPFQVYVLDRFVKGHSFTILGDLSQGIHYYKGVRSWEEMQSLFRPEETAYFALTRSYRSTMEIIEFANEILQRGVGTDLLAVPVFRSGEPVRLLPAAGERRFGAIRHALDKALSGSYRTAAILTRTMREAEELHEELTKAGADIHLINGELKEYAGGVSVLPVYLSKGLEFDAVIVTDVDPLHYGPEDAKLLYVGCTRALHELWLLHGDELPDYVPEENSEFAARASVEG